MDDSLKKPVVEMLLFLSGEPVTVSQIKNVTGLHESDINTVVDELVAEYAARGGGVLIGRIAGGIQMYTPPDLSEWALKFTGTAKSQKLSLPALEALAIIAYRQPITKLEVEELRAANSDGVMKKLFDKRLIKIVGKKEAPGRPMLYGTTREFMEYFGLKDLADLPTLKDLEREETS